MSFTFLNEWYFNATEWSTNACFHGQILLCFETVCGGSVYNLPRYVLSAFWSLFFSVPGKERWSSKSLRSVLHLKLLQKTKEIFYNFSKVNID